MDLVDHLGAEHWLLSSSSSSCVTCVLLQSKGRLVVCFGRLLLSSSTVRSVGSWNKQVVDVVNYRHTHTIADCFIRSTTLTSRVGPRPKNIREPNTYQYLYLAVNAIWLSHHYHHHHDWIRDFLFLLLLPSTSSREKMEGDETKDFVKKNFFSFNVHIAGEETWNIKVGKEISRGKTKCKEEGRSVRPTLFLSVCLSVSTVYCLYTVDIGRRRRRRNENFPRLSFVNIQCLLLVCV